MKKKVRPIVVSDRRYVWWYQIRDGLSVIVSPAGDQTAVVSIEFPCKCDSEELPQAAAGMMPEQILLQKNNEKAAFAILSPAFVSMVIGHLTPEAFVTRKTQTCQGLDLLREMGYQIEEIRYRMYC